MSPERVEQLIDEYVDGTPMTILVKRFGIPRQTICRHAQRAGVIRKPKPFTDTDIARMVSLYESGFGTMVWSGAVVLRARRPGCGHSRRLPHVGG